SCYCGILAGYNGGTVFSESISGTIKGVGEGSTGAIVGKNGTEATIQNSHTSATVIGGDYSDVGGLAGENDGTIKDSFATGNVKPEYGDGQGNNTVGGFVGVNKGTIEQSFATGTISRLYESWSGGLVGSNSGT